MNLLSIAIPTLTLLTTPSLSQTIQIPLSAMPNQSLSSLLPTDPRTTLFAQLVRSSQACDTLLSSTSANFTVIAPSNAALRQLEKKPWEDDADYAAFGVEEAYAGQEGEDRAAGNMDRWIKGHYVRGGEWKKEERRKSEAGVEVWWVERDGKRVIQPSGVEVEDFSGEEAANGQVWVLDGVLSRK